MAVCSGRGCLSGGVGCFFFNDTATTEIYTLSLHDALPISRLIGELHLERRADAAEISHWCSLPDRKSTRLNSSHITLSYAVFCLNKKKKKQQLGIYTTKIRKDAQKTRERKKK